MKRRKRERLKMAQVIRTSDGNQSQDFKQEVHAWSICMTIFNLLFIQCVFMKTINVGNLKIP